jgi:GcrA cell cycle regulator
MPADRSTAQNTSNNATWTTERIQLLKQHFEAGLTCREIAAELGLTRNAVIGKISRLALVRDNGGDTRRLVRPDNGKPGGRPIPKLRRRILRAVPNAPATSVVVLEAVPAENSCSLFELSKERCRWPISTPGAEDFCFCGSTPVDGLPYCASHSRMAYRATGTR